MSRFLDYAMIVVSLAWLIPVGCVACYQLVRIARGSKPESRRP
jgi:hypothetical protein